MVRTMCVVGALLGGLAVAAGAFGAHALKAILSPERLVVFETAVRYQMVHALALIAAGFSAALTGNRVFARAGWFYGLGVGLFSGSLYLLCLLDRPWLGAITPVGGVSFMIGWGLLAWGWWREKGGG